MALVASNLQRFTSGNKVKIIGTLAFDSSYPTGGESLAASALGLSHFDSFIMSPEGGYDFDPEIQTDTLSALIKVYNTAGGTAQTFTGATPSADLNLGTPAFSGTGYATSGQVITTTDNQTMALNQCAGMWFLPPSGAKPAVLILSNTAVTGAPAVLTVQGIAPTTDAGAYKIVTGITPAGTNSAGAAGASVEVANGTNLSALTVVEFEATGS